VHQIMRVVCVAMHMYRRHSTIGMLERLIQHEAEASTVFALRHRCIFRTHKQRECFQ